MDKSEMSVSKLFSVIILSYNNVNFLFDALDSVFIQNYPFIDLIVADDCSHNFSKEDVYKYIEDNSKENIKFVHVFTNEQNLGTVKNANTALGCSRGQYVKFLAADDVLFDSDTLSCAAELLSMHEDRIVLGDVLKCDEEMNSIGLVKNAMIRSMNSSTPKDCFKKLCIHNFIPAGGVFFHHSFFDSFGMFDESYVLLEDWPTWLCCVKSGYKFYHSSFVAIRYRLGYGVGTEINRQYLEDKKKVWNDIIRPAKKEIGILVFVVSWFTNLMITSELLNRCKNMIRRKKLV